MLSADLSPAAGLALVNGLQHLDAVVNNLALTPDGGATAPIVNRSLAELAALGDPIAHLQAAGAAYLSNAQGATIQGLATALNQLPEAHGSATAAVNGSIDTVSVQLTGKINPAALVFDLSGSVGGLSLGIDPGHTANLTGDQTITLSFGVDTSTGAFLLTSGDLAANVHLSASHLQAGLDFGRIATTVTDGTAQLDAGLDVHLVDPANPNGPVAITDHELTSTPVGQLLHTSLTGQASLGLDLTGRALLTPEHVDIAWQAPFDPTAASVSYQPNSTLEQLVNTAPVLGPIQFAAPQSSASPNSDPPLYTEVGSVLTEVQTILNDVQTVINAASVLGGSLPFVGKNLGSENIFGTTLAQINTIQSKLTTDLQNTSTVLSTVQSDIASIFSAAGLLPDGTSDVQLYYLTSLDSSTHPFHGETVDLTNITQLEFDLTIGQKWTSASKIGFDFGLPGLGLSVNNSTIDGSIGWSLSVGFGMSTAGTVYTVLSPGAGNGPTLGLNVAYTLSDGIHPGSNGTVTPAFTALGKMGFLEALIKEKPSDASHPDTGVSGSIGIALGASSNQGTALDGGVELALGDLASINATPTFKLKVQSNLLVAFGGDFQKDAGGNYIDASKFPSLSADFMFDWGINGPSLNDATVAAPTVSLSHLTLDFGQAITDFILPVLKPFYDQTQGLQPFINFMTTEVPVVGTFASWVANNVPGGTQVIQTKLPTFDPNSTYDWLHFGIDLLIDDGMAQSTGEDIEKGAEAVFAIIHQLDTVYSKANTASPTSLGFDLGSFNFGGADLRKTPFTPANATDLANYAGNAIVNFAGLNQADPQVAAAVNSYVGKISSALPAGLRNELGSAIGTISDIYNTLFAAGDLAGGQGPTTQTVDTVATPFFDNPASIVGLLFGQNIDFIKVQVGFSFHDHDVETFPVLSFFRIVDLNLVLDTTLNFDVGLSFGYDTKGLVDSGVPRHRRFPARRHLARR